MEQLRLFTAVHQPAVIIITESWCTPNTSDTHLNMDNYKLYRKDRMTSRGGGCLIYVKRIFHSTSITHEALSLITESVWAVLTLQHSKRLLIGCVYRPPGQSKENDDKLSEAFIRISQLPYKYKIIARRF